MPGMDTTPRYYRHIATFLFLAFCLNAGALVTLNVTRIAVWLTELVGLKKTFLIQLFFWAEMGAVVSSSKYLVHDIETHRAEQAKPRPDTAVLRYPTALDVLIYAQRMLVSGVLGVIGAILFLAGLGHFDVQADVLVTRHQCVLAVLAFLVGLFQGYFLAFLNNLFGRLLPTPGSPDKITT